MSLYLQWWDDHLIVDYNILAKTVHGNGDFNLTFKDFFRSCYQDESLYKALKLDALWDLSTILGINEVYWCSLYHRTQSPTPDTRPPTPDPRPHNISTDVEGCDVYRRVAEGGFLRPVHYDSLCSAHCRSSLYNSGRFRILISRKSTNIRDNSLFRVCAAPPQSYYPMLTLVSI